MKNLKNIIVISTIVLFLEKFNNFILMYLYKSGIFLDSFSNYFLKIENKDISSLIIMIILAPLFEELLFRGFLLTYFKSIMKIQYAIVLTAVLFSLSHFNFVQMIFTFILGILFAIVSHKLDVRYAIYAHIFNNSLVLFDKNQINVLILVLIVINIIFYLVKKYAKK